MASALDSLHAHYGDCDTLPWTNGTGSTVNGDTVREISNKVGIVKEDVDDGEAIPVLVEVPGPGIDLPRNTADSAWSQGDSVYYDSANTEFTIQSANGTLAGYAYEGTAAGDSTGRVVLTNEAV